MKKSLLLLGCSLAAPAAAQDIPAAGPLPASAATASTIVVTGTLTPLEQTGQALTVIGRDEIAAIQGPDIARVLERVPGVTITRNGGLGGFTGVRLRGAGAEQLLVLIDGVRGQDVAAPGGGFDFGNLLAGTVERIDVLRGANSVVWGSDAMGGVLAVTSRNVDGLEASAEYGARDSAYATAAAGLVRSGLSASLNGGYARTDGFSAASAGTEPDGFRQWQLGGRARAELTPALALTATGRLADGRLDIDGYPAPAYSFADTPEYQDTRQWSGRIGALYETSALTLDAGYALSDTRRELFDPTFGDGAYYTTSGRSTRAELFGRVRLPARLALDFGADRQLDKFRAGGSGRAVLTSAHALLGHYGTRLTLAAGARVDDHDRFGSEWTLGANTSLRLAGDWRVRASYGEGFKAPTLFQLLSDFGNAALQPERSKSYDLGIERGSRTAGLHLALTAFRRDSRDQIDFISCASVGLCETRPFGTYDNVGRARAEGFELELGAPVTPTLTARAAYAYVDARNRTSGSADNGKHLARRPEHALTAALDWRTPLGLALGADLRVVGDSYDDAGNFTRLESHTVTTVRAAMPIGETLELFARIENLTDADHETVAGYNAPGRSAYAGVRLGL